MTAVDVRDVVERLRERQAGCDGLCDHQHRARHQLLEDEAADEIVRLREQIAAGLLTENQQQPAEVVTTPPTPAGTIWGIPFAIDYRMPSGGFGFLDADGHLIGWAGLT